MPEITAITPQKKDKTRCNVEIDGRFYCGMKLVTVMQSRLKVGMSIALEELAHIQLESEKQTALDKALHHITASMKPEKEIRDFLTKKGYLKDVCDYVIEKMKGYGFLDDGAYAKAYAESVSKKKGARLIAIELRRKGISEEAIEAALLELTDETESAERVLEKYVRGKDLTDKKTLAKAYAHLIAKGYDYDTARAALEALKETL
ncbi:MAG: RecX family transcriptional regulator [Clostridia bacterium]|nr:RecX family transcriptional regulator [Clostridia bacterium]